MVDENEPKEEPLAPDEGAEQEPPTAPGSRPDEDAPVAEEEEEFDPAEVERKAKADRIGRHVMAIFNLSVIIFLLVAAVSVWKHRGKGGPEQLAETEELQPAREGFVTVTLFFADSDGAGLLSETREVPAAEGDFEARVRCVIDELASGPEGDGAPVLPPDTEVLRLFKDFEGTLYLDMNAAFRTGHWGGAAGELMTIHALRRTIAANFPEVHGMQLLVDGEVVETIAGHVTANQPIPVEW